MLSDFALFLNGVYRQVLVDIAAAQEACPELVLYLQPYSQRHIARFAEQPPTPTRPIPVYASVTDDLNQICFAGEIIGWEDKSEIRPDRRHYVNKTILMHQPTELGGVYANANGSKCVNLLQVRNLRRLKNTIPAGKLTKLSDMKVLGERNQSGGWSYVTRLDELGPAERANG